jgi:coiled-coil and C2 domain-containing protein 2A
LDLGAGDSEEHAMLLCNYFNWVDRVLRRKTDPKVMYGDIESYICYGDAVPNGEGWFVMRRDKSKEKDPKTKKKSNYTEIWDASTGECYIFGVNDLAP